MDKRSTGNMWEFLFCVVSRNDPQKPKLPLGSWGHIGGGFRLPRTPPELTGGLPPPGPPWEVAALRVCMNFLACVSYRGALPPEPPGKSLRSVFA